MFSMNSFEGMRVLSLVRDGDYAHAGEEEAIDLAMGPIARKADQIIVDAGCGRGGTANYIRERGWGRVVGFDIEPASIASAQKTYPFVQFHVCDVCDAKKSIGAKADIVCMFCAYYCFPDQPKALRALRDIAKASAQLVIFDHVDRGTYDPNALMDAGRPFLPKPPVLSQLPQALDANGWKVTAVEEAHDSYIRWYGNLVSRIESKRTEILALAGMAGYEHVLSLYQGLLKAAQRGSLGAAVVRAVPKEVN